MVYFIEKKIKNNVLIESAPNQNPILLSDIEEDCNHHLIFLSSDSELLTFIFVGPNRLSLVGGGGSNVILLCVKLRFAIKSMFFKESKMALEIKLKQSISSRFLFYFQPLICIYV